MTNGTVGASVLICTYNRADLLARTLDSLAATSAPGIGGSGKDGSDALSWEVVVVDNNSTDATADVVRTRMDGYPCALRLVREPRQGKSFALNTGIDACARSIIVFTDDDVWIPPGWLAAGVGPLLAREDIDYTGGPVFPMWEQEPPAWIAGDPGLLWGPIALVDYGREPFIFEDRCRVAMGVNMAVRKSLIDRVGGFHPALERKGASLMGQGQAEFFFRTRAAGARGLYVPEMWLKHHVPGTRLTRQYYRGWWYYKGIARAQMQDLHPVSELGLDVPATPHLAGLPRFMWGTALRDLTGWLRSLAGTNTVRRAEHEMGLAYFAGYARERFRRALHPRGWPAAPSPPDPSAATDPG